MSNIEKPVPYHVVIIPDGNRRWAKLRGQNPWEGHAEGAKRMEEIVRSLRDFSVKHISFWGSSLDNLIKRPLEEKRALLDIYSDYLDRLMSDEDVHRDQTCINFFGRWKEQFPSALVNKIEQCAKETKNYKNHYLNLFLAYSGDDEMLAAIRSIAKQYGPDRTAEITPRVVKEHLFTAALPPVDLVIRTGGEPHWSAGFMMWDIANAQFYFTETLFPDFGPEAFFAALENYATRGRRMGK